jgi:uncharacterized protein
VSTTEPFSNPADEVLLALLTESKTIAVVGASADPSRASNGIFHRLLKLGYRVIPVNPNEQSVHGQPCYPSLADIPEPVDIVNVFRRAEFAPALADEAAAIGARCLWLQLGVSSAEAAARAQRRGLLVVMDRCIAVVAGGLRR